MSNGRKIGHLQPFQKKWEPIFRFRNAHRLDLIVNQKARKHLGTDEKLHNVPYGGSGRRGVYDTCGRFCSKSEGEY
jgi:hypothetical protein